MEKLENKNDNENGNVSNNEMMESYFFGYFKFRTQIVWSTVCFMVIIHLAGIYGLWLSVVQIFRLQFATTIFMYIYGWIAGLFGISIGAHRLWAHKSYKANKTLRLLLMIANSMAGQNSCYSWVRDHRLHHKYSDTNADPHNVTRGFFFSHVGWLMMKKHPDVSRKGKGISLSDLENDPVVMFQKRYFKMLFLMFGVIIPVFIPCYFWNETFYESLFISFFFRYILLLNITWTINSVAHMFGNRPYDKNIKPVQNVIIAFFAYGEGWHNYHHTFPWDYKSSEFGMKFNFACYVIEFFEKIGWAYDLKRVSPTVLQQRTLRTGDGTHETIKN